MHHRLEEITSLVTGVKSYRYRSPTARNYAASYWHKILLYIYHRLEDITPLVTGVKSYSMYITDWKKLRR